LDGTLVHLPVDWSKAVRHIENLLGTEFRSLLKLLPKIWETEKYEIISRTIEEYELASLSRLKFLDDSPTLLKELSSKYQLGLVTFQGKNVTRKIIIDKIGISGIPMATRDDNPTRVGQISLILSNIPLDANDVLVIGDRFNDVYSALEVGCHAILVDRQGSYEANRNGKGFSVISTLKNYSRFLCKKRWSGTSK
jgi:phosphoglycolate phosphatase-like HAD superfamily hydrolase